jgi:hypothetical protein
MSEPMRAPMRRQLTSGRIPTAALLPGAQRPREETPLPGHLCEVCLDAPAVTLVPAPWGNEMGVCAACAPPAVPDCPHCVQSPGPGEDATAYVQHCIDTGHPLRPGTWRVTGEVTLRDPARLDTPAS